MGGYDRHRENAGRRQREQSRAGRDIGPLPLPVDLARRESCRFDFRLFCETYFSAAFNLAWSEDHLRVIQIIQTAVLTGGLFAVAMPRGYGKTTLSVAAAVWALLYGHRAFVVLIASTEVLATKLLKNIMAIMESNALLIEDFPAACYPIKRLDRIAHRASGQLLDGVPTRMVWTASELVLPTVKGAVSSGSRVCVAGLTGAVRGLQASLADGTIIRPDFVLLDDPQTKESAQSPKQVADRLDIIKADVLGLAGPTKKIAAVAPVTVVARGDVADQLLDRKKNPEWQGVKTKLMRSMPTNAKLWEEYAEIWANELRNGRGIAKATEFYVEHKADMDAGADASWIARYNADEASAVQNAMNLKLRDELSFAAEYQNEPLALDAETPLLLKPEQVTAKVIATPRGIVPKHATKLTSFIDVQGTILYYVVCAWAADFTGHVLDYGTYPEQDRNYFTLREVARTLAVVNPHAAFEAQLYDGLKKLTAHLLTKEWPIESGGSLRISRLFIDSGYASSVVHQFVRESALSALMLPSKGIGITADRKPMNDYVQKPGERTGWNWRIMPLPERHIFYDTNSWKTFVAQRVVSAPGETGNLSLFHGSGVQHRLFAEHATSETPKPTEGGGRLVNVWHKRPGRENHLFDCLVGSAVAASEQGCLFVGHQAQAGEVKRPRRRIEVSF